MRDVFGNEFRRVENREHQGKPASVAIAIRTYETSIDDLWEAVTRPERLARWFLPVEGELKVDGRYQLQGNAGGTITRCDAPTALDLTWEAMGATSWLNVRLQAEGNSARLILEHIAHKDGPGADHLEKFGPAAVGVGWDLGLLGLDEHMAAPTEPIDRDAWMAWMQSEEGKDFIRKCGTAWGEAHKNAGEEPAAAEAKAARTIAFYTGE